MESKFKKSKLRDEQQAKVYDLIEEHHKVLGLHDEMGTCPQIEVHLKLHDEVPFSFCPYAIL